MTIKLEYNQMYTMGIDMICNVGGGGGGLMTIAHEAHEKFPPRY